MNIIELLIIDNSRETLKYKLTQEDKMKKLISILLVLALSFTVFTACGSKEEAITEEQETVSEETEIIEEEPEQEDIVIGVSMNSADEFRSAWLDTFTQQAEEKGYKIISTNADNKADKQISDIESLIQQKIDIAVVHAFSSDGIVPAIDALNDADIPIVLVDFEIDSENFDARVSDEQFQNGVIQGEYVNDWLAEDPERVANVGYIVGSYSMESAMPRMDGFFETATEAVKLAEGEGGWSSDGAMTLTEDWMQVHPDMNVFVAMSDEMALGVIQALKGAGKDMDDVLVLGIDGSDEGFAAIKAGELDATAARDIEKEARVALETAEKILAGETVEKEIRPMAIASVTIDNVDDFS